MTPQQIKTSTHNLLKAKDAAARQPKPLSPAQGPSQNTLDMPMSEFIKTVRVAEGFDTEAFLNSTYPGQDRPIKSMTVGEFVATIPFRTRIPQLNLKGATLSRTIRLLKEHGIKWGP